MAILLSGRGSNMLALAQRCAQGDLEAKICFVASDKKDAYGIMMAKSLGLKTLLLPYEEGKEQAEKVLNEKLQSDSVDWIVLAGFMRMLSPTFVGKYEKRIVNIHPSLLPSFPGTQAIKDAFEYGVKVTGVTVHLVDEKMDHGPILSQREVRICDEDTLESLEEKIHAIEHDLYWQTLKNLFAGRFKMKGRRMTIEGPY
ncbi:phosphoribosylglycinamide formyltransferase [Acetomicrobium sp.]|jgi:phosphoribosylglycinamide formyltransferase-1|uniref:phosphoribosylglycinamide formyltransferase n=1 Tax=Acetomicrobium sp. TaxID=1872099 RepID=UPI0028723137|nr:phosphoribosylglycinamide formyltransferase [Acetomicrobium sp.]MDR9769050.1 phosphoribosylglycinamide formyltransferase [Acetomicrobium sp.]